ncbi:MAG TPA: HAMP domain-containing sensor histidine kinase [Micromonosporaceae bacterium]
MTGPAVPAVAPAPATRPRGRRRWGGLSLTWRAALVTCLVAVIAVVITAAVALPLILRSANDEAQRQLADKARVAANAIDRRGAGVAESRENLRARAVAQTLREQGVATIVIRDGQPDQVGLPAKVVRQISAGQPVSQRILYQGRLHLAEGRPVGTGDGIVLLQPSTTVSARALLNRIWLALGAGLLAGLLAGVLLARRLSRPLRQVAVTARRLSAGDRTARAPTDAPAEIADVSVALNDLAGALTTSENRQRSFLMSVSHELRTPLTTIRGYAEALADGVVGQDEAQRAGATMLAESEHLDRLVGDLLVLARLEADDFPLEIMQVELVSLLANAAESWSPRCAAVGVRLRTELPGHAVLLATDPGRVRQVVDGLLENALRVVPPGAAVVLAVRVTGAASADESTLAFPVAGQPPPPAPATGAGGRGTTGSLRSPVLLEVRDGGPGFADEDLAVAFDQGVLYQRYKGVRKVGSGLGLALAARLVRRLGGQIEAGHAPEGGARITVRLPR